MHAHRRLGVILAILAALIIAAPTAAASPWTSFSQSGISASADTSDCIDNTDGTVTCSGEGLFVFEGKIKTAGEKPRSGDEVCYSWHTDTFDPETGETVESESLFGCALDAGTLTADNLTSVVLAPTLIELMTFTCDESECTEVPAGSITVEATWSGVGPIIKQAGRFHYDDGTCVQVDSQKGAFREASFDGPFEVSFAQLSEGSSTFRTNCDFGL
jgi:hypothetical protein